MIVDTAVDGLMQISRQVAHRLSTFLTFQHRRLRHAIPNRVRVHEQQMFRRQQSLPSHHQHRLEALRSRVMV